MFQTVPGSNPGSAQLSLFESQKLKRHKTDLNLTDALPLNEVEHLRNVLREDRAWRELLLRPWMESLVGNFEWRA